MAYKAPGKHYRKGVSTLGLIERLITCGAFQVCNPYTGKPLAQGTLY